MNESLEIQIHFLHEHYFLRIKWADLVGSVIWPSLLNYVLMFRWKLFVDLFLLCAYSARSYPDDGKGDEEGRGGSIAGRSGF